MPEADAPPSPGSAFGPVEDVAEDAAGEAADAATDAASESSESINVLDALMSTEPDVKPRAVSEQLGLGPAGANAAVGTRKVINAATGVGKKGTTALENYIAAGFHFIRGRDAGDDDVEDDQEASDQEGEVFAQGPEPQTPEVR